MGLHAFRLTLLFLLLNHLRLKKALRDRAEALELRGQCYIQLGDFEMAANHFREVR